ncbi:MAG: hypothetical protein LBN74_08225 [Prevotella sp.]|jgi:hypothetical protein|nr:hypothetical protein [Prevotella sp.]
MKLEFIHKEGWASHNDLDVVQDNGKWNYSGFVSTNTQGQSFHSDELYDNKEKALIEGLNWMLNYHKDSTSNMSVSVSKQIKVKIQELQQPQLTFKQVFLK